VIDIVETDNKARTTMGFSTAIFRSISRAGIVMSMVATLVASSVVHGVENGVTDEQMQHWRRAAFGMFVHWGAYAYLAGTWNGQPVNGYSEHIMRSMEIPLAEYKNKVVANFNPQEFDADEWVQIAKAAGMRYIVITAKHHDGFAMWDSQLTDYDIIDSTAFGRDPMRELRDAAKKAGLLFGFYYSHAQDWSHPFGQRNSRDFGYEQPGQRRWWEQPEWSEYVGKSWSYVNGKSIPQMEELITGYDPDIMWFDTHNWLPKELTQVIVERAKELKPDLIINSRGTPDIKDYASTNDRPEYFQRTNLEYWEGIPTTNESYGYHAHDMSHKPVSFFVRLIVRAAARGGNLLMNVGPMGNGKIDPIDVRILKGIGDWLIPNGESIYGVERTPLPVQGWGDTTVKGNRLYLHVMDWPDSGELVVGGLTTKVNKVRFLTENDAANLDFRRLNDLDVAISIPEAAPDTLSTVIVLELDEPPVADKSILLNPDVPSNMLHVFEGELHGDGIKWGGGNVRSNFIQRWPSAADYISWSVRANESERYKVTARYTGTKQNLGNTYTVEIAGQSLDGAVAATGKHRVIELGEVTVPKGHHTLRVKAKTQKPGSDLVNLTDISFVPVK
jgi:alpha-L-fucosidase